MSVVRDKENRSLEGVESLLENVGACDIQVVGRFVETQKRIRRDEHLRQRETTFFAAGENADAFVDASPTNRNAPSNDLTCEMVQPGATRSSSSNTVLPAWSSSS